MAKLMSSKLKEKKQYYISELKKLGFKKYSLYNGKNVNIEITDEEFTLRNWDIDVVRFVVSIQDKYGYEIEWGMFDESATKKVMNESINQIKQLNNLK